MRITISSPTNLSHKFDKLILLSRTSSDFTNTLNHFTAISQSQLHIVFNNDHPLTYYDATEILFAMSHKKTIIMLVPPRFDSDIDLFARQAIETRLNKIVLCDVMQLEKEDLANLLSSVYSQECNFSLTKKERLLIKYRVRKLFRDSQ